MARFVFFLPDCEVRLFEFGPTVFFFVDSVVFFPLVVVCDNNGVETASSVANSNVVSLVIKNSPPGLRSRSQSF
jgi:hypothetical protein